ncbi:Flavodoxin reductases (ferredoxin-NADPH reductases) family 1 / Vanillate O-demethylase oxidoreductase (EC [Amycolatopsis camponoti]|uniref:Flavodoxin reductases (Ferredoxin-NADPH reductases) family 1 / Vanillate O-demethylase oxidoreductase (EC) n=2 Tax=Amycolatopsis camponoti TaxID=2606593 RepID=A0A6I8LYE2_9PSEU|nr:PDR/VanB family oxidoreductase [Amycolatopsis camponoti]VVJ23235.1 Flavodoxin reductases (ferredoxin-NADPH reductases) family 1 / Vanillate O-demethylase oxidoreductase (EC [Amycolatopsis camponoti]
MTLGRPTRLDGSDRTDRLMSTLVGVVGVYRRMSQFSGKRRPPVRAVDRNLPLVVEAVEPEAEGVVSLRLANGSALPGWRPGAHIDLVLPSGLVRQYSLCGNPSEKDHYRIAVRQLGVASTEVHALTPGTRVTVRGPRTAFPFVGEGPFLFIAGGIGITPILPMVGRCVESGADWRLVYTGRSRASMPFLDELPDDDRVRIRPDTEYGIPASGAELLEGLPEGASVYCCGPAPMITGVRVDLALTRGAVHFERFAPPPIVAGEPFRLALRRSGLVLDVPGDRSALDVILEARPGTPYSCRQGFCGTCAVPAADGGSVRICVDRGTAVLDL